MKLYFQDLKPEIQDKLRKEVRETVKLQQPDYKFQAEYAGMTVEDWLIEAIEYHINTHNFPIDVEY